MLAYRGLGYHGVLKQLTKKCLARPHSNSVFNATVQDKFPWKSPEGVDVGIRIDNSLCRKAKVPLILKDPHVATWYSCGPTVYDDAHLGHAFCYVKFDIIQRVLEEFFDIRVIHQMGITDIDDKIIRRCLDENVSLESLTKRYEVDFLRDLASLNVKTPALLTRVTDYVPQIVAFVRAIVNKGMAYACSDGSVYFDMTAYCEHIGLELSDEDVLEEPRMDDQSAKRHPADFALWKGCKPGEPWWEAPWGRGRPGWHIECSVMASHTFGSSLDFHSGGVDLLFPHHHNEFLQSSVYHGCQQWVNYWLHAGHLTWRKEKMSKSLKNTITIQEFLQHYSAVDFRILCLYTKLRHDVDFSDDTIAQAQRIYDRLQTFQTLAWDYVRGSTQQGAVSESEVLQRLQETRTKVRASLCDNFNTHAATDALLDLVLFTFQQVSEEPASNVRCPSAVASVASYVENTMGKLGVDLNVHAQSFENSEVIKQFMDQFVEFRHDVRRMALNKKDEKLRTSDLLKLCDEQREKMKRLGITVRDHKNRSTWTPTTTKPIDDEAKSNAAN